jgi:hypothetical protein
MTAPDAPTPLAPAPLDGDTITNPLPQFVWSNESDAEGTPVTYDLEVASDLGFTTELHTFSDLGQTDYQLLASDSLEFGQFWHWRVRAKDEVGNQSAFSDVQSFYVKHPFIVGDLNGDEVHDAVDLNILIEVLFFNGVVPVPPDERADLDCSGTLDAVDLNDLIDVLFFNAPQPVCP